jgi:hypothetical protein
MASITDTFQTVPFNLERRFTTPRRPKRRGPPCWSFSGRPIPQVQVGNLLAGVGVGF